MKHPKRTTRKNRKSQKGGSSRNIHENLTIVVEPYGHQCHFRALYQGTEVGTADTTQESETMVLQNLYVNPLSRGKKVGTLLLGAVLKYAFHQPEVQQVTLEDLTQSNQYNPTKIPNQMYKKAGFVHTHPNHPYYKNDMVLTWDAYLQKTHP